ncbi:general secretion pathway protein GspB [Lysobacter brunescens]|uniref:General secretion pathway protein GspB n=1 Tax=Lysobacter brunescens TaxID=262323 RepID=A0ABW2YDE9_9GAMM
MSFILEALRKSEAERRRSETPDLFSAMHDAPAPARERRHAPVWIVGVVGVLSLGVATWLVLQREPVPASTTQIDPAPQATTAETQVAAPDANQAPPPATAPTPPVAPTAIAPSPTPSIATPPPAPAPVAATPVAPPPAPALPEPPTPRPSAARSDAPIALSELDAGSRKQLPALKMSMHMWNQDAGRRFVILDGQRLGEGDLIGEAQVETITRDGVILNWQGARLRLDTR